MIRSFKSKALDELWEKGRTAKINAKVHARVFRRLDRLDAAAMPEEMNIPGFDFHALRGFKPTRYSVHVNGPWCITFEFEDGDACRIDFEQITERDGHGSCHQAQSGSLPDPSRRFAEGGRDPGYRQDQGRDCAASRHFRAHLYDILRERKPVSPAVAVRLGKLFGDGAGVWVRMQAAYDTWHAEREEDVSGIPTFHPMPHKHNTTVATPQRRWQA